MATSTKEPAKPRRKHTSSPGRRTKTYLDNDWRNKIRRGVLIKRLEDNALGKLIRPMTADQIRSADIVLKKCAADLKQVEVVGNQDQPVEMVIKWQE